MIMDSVAVAVLDKFHSTATVFLYFAIHNDP